MLLSPHVMMMRKSINVFMPFRDLNIFKYLIPHKTIDKSRHPPAAAVSLRPLINKKSNLSVFFARKTCAKNPSFTEHIQLCQIKSTFSQKPILINSSHLNNSKTSNLVVFQKLHASFFVNIHKRQTSANVVKDKNMKNWRSPISAKVIQWMSFHHNK